MTKKCSQKENELRSNLVSHFFFCPISFTLLFSFRERDGGGVCFFKPNFGQKVRNPNLFFITVNCLISQGLAA